MKLKLLSALVLVGTAFASQQALAADGTITFSGTISASTCTINGGTAGANSFSVTLPPVGTTALSVAGQTAGTTPFQIALTACPTTVSAHAFFEPATATDMTTGRLKNTIAVGSGGATNVQVALLNDDLTVIDAGKADGSQNSLGASLSTGGATLKYRAQYYATGIVGAGTVSSNVAYTIIYN